MNRGGRRVGEHHERVGGAAPVRHPSDRAFGFAASAVVLGLGAVSYLRTGGVHWWVIGVAAALLVCGAAAPTVLSPLNRAWSSIGAGLSRLTSPIVLAVVYAVVIVPAGLVMRLYRRDPLARRFDRSAASYWTPRSPDSTNMNEQF